MRSCGRGLLVAAVFTGALAGCDDDAVVPPVTHALTVMRNGSGTGTVTSSPAGIDCGADCTESYAAGTLVTLMPTPDAGSEFSGWTGAGCVGIGTCEVTLTFATTVTATFAQN